MRRSPVPTSDLKLGLVFSAIAMSSLLASFGSGAAAATVDLRASSAAREGLGPAGDGVSVVQSQVIDTDTLDGPTEYTVSASATDGSSSSGSFGSVDIATGQLRSRSFADFNTSPFVTDLASASSNVSFTEWFTASGSGNITAFFGFDGFWDLTRETGSPLFGAQVSISSLTFGQNDVFLLNPGDGDPNTGSIDDVLQFSFYVTDGRRFSITSNLNTQIRFGSGFVDFSNTATLFFETDDGVTLTPDDPRVLSVDPAVIPLPAALPMLLAGLGGLGLVARRRVHPA